MNCRPRRGTAVQSSTWRSGGVGFQSINHSFNIYMVPLQDLLQGCISSLFTKSLNPSSVLFKIRNSNKYGNGVSAASISVETPFSGVPIGNELWFQWLRIDEPINFKLFILGHKCINNCALRYLAESIRPLSD